MIVAGIVAPYAALEKDLGYKFTDPALCQTALTHKSWINETHEGNRGDNERLEFLGDAVLALVVSDLLMKHFPGHPEGELSKTRAALVNEGGLARVAESLALGQWIFLGRGEEQAGGRQKRSILSDALEALIGAVYLDGGFGAAYQVAEHLFRPSLAGAEVAAGRDFKSRLQEISQARLQLAPTYTVVSQQGPDHDKTFEVAIFLGPQEYGRARGKSKKEAQQNAAAQALAVLEGAAPGSGSVTPAAEPISK
jgi:ribonuclease-3